MNQIDKTEKEKEREKEKPMLELLIEIKLSINRKLFEKGYITKEMYSKAQDLILKS